MNLKRPLRIAAVGMVLSVQVGLALAAGDGSSFAIRADYSCKEIFDVYEKLQRAGRSQFITTDLALHSGHLLFDYSLRAIEFDKLYDQAEKLTKAMVKAVPPARFSERLTAIAEKELAGKPLTARDDEFICRAARRPDAGEHTAPWFSYRTAGPVGPLPRPAQPLPSPA